MATVTRLPAKSVMKTDQKELLRRVETKACSRGVRKRKEPDRSEDNEKDTSPSKLDALYSDLQMAILTRVPAKSLWKLRCVSKMWSSIIRSQEFVDYFFAMSSTQSRFIVSLSNGLATKPEEKLTFFFSFAHEGEESSSLVPNFEMAIPVGSAFYPEFLASHHGFLSFYSDRRLMVCNPSTEQVIKLPMYTLHFVGYDPIGGQHKALPLRPKDGNHSTGLILHNVLTFGGCQGWRDIEGTRVPHIPLPVGVSINGFIYYGAFNSTDFRNPVVVCFDVRSEKFSFIQAPRPVLFWRKYSIFIEYNGKLASIVRESGFRFSTFDLWILEDAEKHEWSKQTCVFPSSAWDSVWNHEMCFSGTNKAGEIIMVPNVLSPKVQPFYIFYYNVRTNNVRSVRLLGFGDNEEFRRSYGFVGKQECFVRLAPKHVDSIAFLKNHAT